MGVLCVCVCVRIFFGGDLLEGRGEEERGEVGVPVDLLSFFGLLLDLERQYSLCTFGGGWGNGH